MEHSIFMGKVKVSRAIRYASTLAFFYAVLASAYIYFSSYFAKLIAGSSVERLNHLENIKGMAFAIITSLLLLAFAYLVFRRIAADSEELKRQREKTLAAERQGLAGLLTMAIAHDCNNLVMILSSASHALRADSSLSADAAMHVSKIAESAKSLRHLLVWMHKSGRDIARGVPQLLDLRATVLAAVDMARGHINFGKARVTIHADQELKIYGYGMLLQQLVINLVINAAEATGGSGTIRLSLFPESDGTTALVIEDDGPGIPPGLRESIFNPYVTTKKGGQGLGLLSVKACVESHGGTLELARSTLGGAAFRITFPQAVPEPVSAVGGQAYHPALIT